MNGMLRHDTVSEVFNKRWVVSEWFFGIGIRQATHSNSPMAFVLLFLWCLEGRILYLRLMEIITCLVFGFLSCSILRLTFLFFYHLTDALVWTSLWSSLIYIKRSHRHLVYQRRHYNRHVTCNPTRQTGNFPNHRNFLLDRCGSSNSQTNLVE